MTRTHQPLFNTPSACALLPNLLLDPGAPWCLHVPAQVEEGSVLAWSLQSIAAYQQLEFLMGEAWRHGEWAGRHVAVWQCWVAKLCSQLLLAKLCPGGMAHSVVTAASGTACMAVGAGSTCWASMELWRLPRLQRVHAVVLASASCSCSTAPVRAVKMPLGFSSCYSVVACRHT